MSGNSQIADLILQLMMRGKSGGLPMQASPELTQYIAHAQAGTAPAAQRVRPSADVLPGPGSGMAEIRNPDFLSNMEAGPVGATPPFAPAVDPMDMVGGSRPPSNMFRQEAPGEFDPGQIFIWYTHPKTGQRMKLDGPFSDDISAHRAMQELRREGVTDQLEVSPY